MGQMTTTFALRIGKDKATSHNTTLADLEKMMDESCNELATIAADCNTFVQKYMRGDLKSGDAYYMHVGNIDRDLKRHGFFSVNATTTGATAIQSWEISFIQELSAACADMVMRCVEYKKDASTGRSSSLSGYAVKVSHKNSNSIVFDVVCSPTDSCCPKCGALLATSSLQRHIGTTTCITTSLDASLEKDRDFTRISNDQLERAIEKAGIEFERHPIAFGTWAPKWALDAYRSFKHGGGYAGMTLAEYLKRMKPDDKK
jgi:hypothetical protein